MPYYYHAKSGGNWTTNKGEMEGAQCAPPPQPDFFTSCTHLLTRSQEKKFDEFLVKIANKGNTLNVSYERPFPIKVFKLM